MASERIPFLRCPLCEGDELTVVATASCAGHPLYHPSLGSTMRWQRCSDCKHVFTDGYYSATALEVIFDKTHAYHQVGADLEAQRVRSSRVVEKILPYVASGTWLDVGFGNGSLLLTAQEYGFPRPGLICARAMWPE